MIIHFFRNMKTCLLVAHYHRLVTISQSPWRHCIRDVIRYQHRCDKLKSQGRTLHFLVEFAINIVTANNSLIFVTFTLETHLCSYKS